MSSPHVLPHAASMSARHPHVMPLPQGPPQASFTGALTGSDKQISRLSSSGVSQTQVVDLTLSSDDEQSDPMVISRSSFNQLKRKRPVASCTASTVGGDEEDDFPADFGLLDVDEMEKASDGSGSTKRRRSQSLLDADPFNSDKQASMHDRSLDVRRFMASQVSVKCCKCDKKLFESKKSLMECTLTDLSQPTKICATCEESRCLGCGHDFKLMNEAHVCENARVFAIWLVLYHLDKTNLMLKVRSMPPRKAASRKLEELPVKPKLATCLASGVGYGGPGSYDGDEGDFIDSNDEDDYDDEDGDDDEEDEDMADDDTEDDAEYQQAVRESLDSHKLEVNKVNEHLRCFLDESKNFQPAAYPRHEIHAPPFHSTPASTTSTSIQGNTLPESHHLTKSHQFPPVSHSLDPSTYQQGPGFALTQQPQIQHTNVQSAPNPLTGQFTNTFPPSSYSKLADVQSQHHLQRQFHLPHPHTHSAQQPIMQSSPFSSSSLQQPTSNATQLAPPSQPLRGGWAAWSGCPSAFRYRVPRINRLIAEEANTLSTDIPAMKPPPYLLQHQENPYCMTYQSQIFDHSFPSWPSESHFTSQSRISSSNSTNLGLTNTHPKNPNPNPNPNGNYSPSTIPTTSPADPLDRYFKTFPQIPSQTSSTQVSGPPNVQTPPSKTVNSYVSKVPSVLSTLPTLGGYPYPNVSSYRSVLPSASPQPKLTGVQSFGLAHDCPSPKLYGSHGSSKFEPLSWESYAKKKPFHRASGKHKEVQKPAEPAPPSPVEVRLEQLVKILPCTERDSSFDITPPKTILSMIICSRLLEVLSELLRNDSLTHVCKHSSLYHAAWKVLEIIATHYSLVAAVQMPQAEKPQDVGLERLSYLPWIEPDLGQKAPLVKCLNGIFTQSKSVLRRSQKSTKDFESEDGQVLVFVCQRLAELEQLVEDTTPVVTYEAARANAGNAGEEQALKAGENSASTGQDEAAWHRSICVSEVEDETMLEHHVFAPEATKMAQSPKGRMRHLVEEIVNLETSLPPAIFVRYASSRMDVIKALIIGPADTPYESGLFEFDILCPMEYPSVPPKVKFKTTGSGRAHFNPNLYNNGKVCLSLLGTWSGTPWKAGESTLLQVLVSIQSMIFCEYPWYNEPGREAAYGLKDYRAYGPAVEYNKEIQALTTKHAIIGWIRDGENSIWPDLVKHYLQNQEAHERVRNLLSKWALNNKRINDTLNELNQVSPFGPTPNTTTSSGGNEETQTATKSSAETGKPFWPPPEFPLSTLAATIPDSSVPFPGAMSGWAAPPPPGAQPPT